MIKVSIIVPVYNISEKLLTKCLDSLVSQSLEKIEIILVDDCSTLLETIELLNIFNDKYSNIKLITHDINKKQGGARNSGTKEASGEYIGFVDADDYIDQNMYKLLYEKAIEEEADIVDCNYIEVNSKGQELNKLNNIENMSYHGLIVDGGRLWTKIFKRNMIIENNIFFPENMFYEDNAIGGLHILYANKISKVEQYLYYYVRHTNSTVSNANLHLNDKIKAGKIFYETMNARGFLDIYKDELLIKYFEIYFKSTYRLIMKYDKNYMQILSAILKDMKSNGVNIKSKDIQNRLKLKEKIEIWLLNNFPKIFQIYVDIKFKKYKASK